MYRVISGTVFILATAPGIAVSQSEAAGTGSTRCCQPTRSQRLLRRGHRRLKGRFPQAQTARSLFGTTEEKKLREHRGGTPSL